MNEYSLSRERFNPLDACLRTEHRRTSMGILLPSAEKPGGYPGYC